MKNNTNDILVSQNEKNEYNINVENTIIKGVDDSVVELLNELRAVNDPLYPEVKQLLNTESTLNDLTALLYLTQTVFTNFSFKLDLDKNIWQEVGSNLTRLRRLYPVYNDIINIYVENVDLTNINIALKPNEVIEADKQIRTYFKMSA